ncbi:hypothetical protein BC938DRAFT_476948 [Jimgerdemannia flammicorona]|uniref:HMG box domain-containing protein n=1 Tax=Jimgerdemannia flammicorona TaxID=994334 RepID=A0A433PD03_9FUNG|nr:hypothetical protein BC938DRAFT_476948 [Jimgerdemannia flammicorona]
MGPENNPSNESNIEDTATALDNHQQDINSKSDTQTYNVYLVPNGYEPLLVASQLAQGKSATRPPSQKRSIPIRLPHPAESTKKKNLKKIPRPKNCFMAYRMDKQHEIMKQWPGVNNKDISRIVGSMWKQESEEEKGRYKAIAEELKKCHAREYPGYKFSPKKKTQKNNLKKQEPQLVSSKFNANESDKNNTVFNQSALQHATFLATPTTIGEHMSAGQCLSSEMILASINHHHYRGASIDSLDSESNYPTMSSEFDYSHRIISDVHLLSHHSLDNSSSSLRYEIPPEMADLGSETDRMMPFRQMTAHCSYNSGRQLLEEDCTSCPEDYISDATSPPASISSPMSHSTANNIMIAGSPEQARGYHTGLQIDPMLTPAMHGNYADEYQFHIPEHENIYVKTMQDMPPQYTFIDHHAFTPENPPNPYMGYSNAIYMTFDGLIDMEGDQHRTNE